MIQCLSKNRIIYHASRNSKAIFLTFDDGPCQTFTSKILDVLDNRGVKATFFLTGKTIQDDPLIIKRMKKSGHSIGNHTFSHKKISKLKKMEIIDEVSKGKDEIEKIIDERVSLLRPPNGRISFNLFLAANANKQQIVLWSVDSLDWHKKSTDSILNNVCSDSMRAGDIILFHDDNKFTLEALPKVIEFVVSKGFKFATL